MFVKRIFRPFFDHRLNKSSVIGISMVLLFAVTSRPDATGAPEDLPIGARSLAMGATYVALANSADAVFLNPGGLSQMVGTEISFFYQKPFGLKDLNFGTATATFPVSNYRLSVGFLSMGNGVYDQTEVALALSHHLGKAFYYGASLRYQSVAIESFGSSSTLGLGFGAVIPITESLKCGFQVNHVNRSKVGQSEDKLPRTFKGGLSLSPDARLTLSLEIFKEVGFDEEVRFGTEFKPLENFALRAGTATNPDRFSAGFGVNIEPFQIDYAFFTHNDLGLTHQLSFSIHFGKNQDQTTIRSRVHNNENSADRRRRVTTWPIDINTAPAADLIKLPGIGSKTAAAILNYRKTHGPFSKIEELQRVPGIGPKKIEAILSFITVRKSH